MPNLLNDKRFPLIVFLCFFNFGFSQIKEQKKDSTGTIYKKIENYSEKTKTTKFLHLLVFKSSKKKKNKTAASHRQVYRDFEGKVIRNIIIRSNDPFGFSFKDSTETANSWLEKTGNNLHVKSKDFAIKNYLIFKEKEPLDSLLVKESERLLRSQSFIRDVRISVKQVAESSDSVDVFITTLDSWSIVPDASFSPEKMKIQLREQNFWGFGHQFRVGTENRFSDGKYAPDLLYRIPNIKNTYISTSLGYNINLEGAYSKRINIERPFFSPYTKWAAGIYLDEQFRREELQNAALEFELQNFKYQSQDVWAGYSFPLFKGSSGKERTTRVISALRLLNIDYDEIPTTEYDSIGFFSNETFYLGSIGISSRQFVDDSYLFRDGVTESVPIGDIYSITAGNQYKNNQNRFYLGAKIAHGNYHKWGYLSVGLEYGTFFNKSKTEQTAYSFGANYFTNLISLGNNWKMRQFIKPQLLIGKNRLNSLGDRLTIDENNDFQGFYSNEEQRNNNIGIPGFYSGLYGTSKYVLSLQTQFYSPKEILGFRFNPYLNVRLAMLGNENLIVNSDLYSAFSVGLIIRNDYLVFSSFQLSLSYFPSIPGQGHNIFDINTINTGDFGLQGFEMGKPAPVWYN